MTTEPRHDDQPRPVDPAPFAAPSDRPHSSAYHSPRAAANPESPRNTAPTTPTQWPYVLSPDSGRVRPTAYPAPPPRRLSILAALLAGAFVFIAALAVGGLEFRSFARFRLDPNLSDADVAAVRLKLLDYLLSLPSARDPDTSAWMVRANDGYLRFAARAGTPRQSTELAKRLAEDFAATIEKDAQALEQTPTQAERFVGENLDLQRTRTDATGRRLSEARAQLPATDPRLQQNELLQRWRDRKDALQSASLALQSSESRLAELRRSEPTTVAADPADIANAERANLGLQQDLREMDVNLTEVRTELLRADDAAQPSFEAAANAAANLRYEAGDAALNHPDLPGVSPLTANATEYETLLTTLRSDWGARIASLRGRTDQLPPDVLVDAQETLQKFAGDFAYAAEPRIGEIERLAAALADARAGRSQHHELMTTLVRLAQTLAAEHRRIAFAVAGASLTDNFRLDAAMRSARALHARCRAVRQSITDRLSAAALAEAKTTWAAALAAAESAFNESRAAHDRAVGELLTAHEELIESFRGAAGYVELLTRADIDDAALRTGQEDLRRIEEQLDTLLQARLAAARSPISPAGVEIDPWPVNIVPRLYTAGTAGLATLIAMLMGQFWLTRRTEPGLAR